MAKPDKPVKRQKKAMKGEIKMFQMLAGVRGIKSPTPKGFYLGALDALKLYGLEEGQKYVQGAGRCSLEELIETLVAKTNATLNWEAMVAAEAAAKALRAKGAALRAEKARKAAEKARKAAERAEKARKAAEKRKAKQDFRDMMQQFPYLRDTAWWNSREDDWGPVTTPIDKNLNARRAERRAEIAEAVASAKAKAEARRARRAAHKGMGGGSCQAFKPSSKKKMQKGEKRALKSLLRRRRKAAEARKGLTIETTLKVVSLRAPWSSENRQERRALLASQRETTRAAFLKAAGESQEATAKQAKINEQEALLVSNSSKAAKLEADLVKLNVRLAGFESKVRDLNEQEVIQRVKETDEIFRKNTKDLAAEDDFKAAKDDYAKFQDVAKAAALVKTQVEAIEACKETIRAGEATAEALRAELNQLYASAASSFDAAQSEMAEKRAEVQAKLAELRNNRPMIEKVVPVKRVVKKKAARKAEEAVDVSLGKIGEGYTKTALLTNGSGAATTAKKALPNAVGCAAYGFADERRQEAFDRGMEILASEDARDAFMPGWPQYRLWDDQDKRAAEAREAKKALSKRLEAYKAMKASAAMKAVITVGIPGCGKSTWAAEYAKQTGARVIELDMARAVVNGNAASQDNFGEVLALHKAWIAEAAAANRSIVVSDTNLVKQFRDELKTHLESLGYVVEIKVFFTSHEVSKARNASRDRVVPEHAMDRMIQLFNDEFGAVNA